MKEVFILWKTNSIARQKKFELKQNNDNTILLKMIIKQSVSVDFEREYVRIPLVCNLDSLRITFQAKN